MPESIAATILLTGATGNIGRELTKKLSSQEVPFRAMVRSSRTSTEVAATAGVEIVIADFNDSKSIAHALKGVDRAFLLTPHSFDDFSRDYASAFLNQT